MRALVIEDDPEMLGFLAEHLPKHAFAVDATATGKEGLAFTERTDYDVIVLDLNLPDMTGEAVVEALHKEEVIAPILMLTVVGDTESKIRLLHAGADDYLEKPFSFEELVARMQALLRRARTRTPETLRVGEVSLNTQTQRVERASTPLSLTAKEFALLEYLMRHPGTIISKGKLIEHVWNASVDPFSNAIETHFTNLRKKLGEPAVIRTEHGRGYVIG